MEDLKREAKLFGGDDTGTGLAIGMLLLDGASAQRRRARGTAAGRYQTIRSLNRSGTRPATRRQAQGIWERGVTGGDTGTGDDTGTGPLSGMSLLDGARA